MLIRLFLQLPLNSNRGPTCEPGPPLAPVHRSYRPTPMRKIFFFFFWLYSPSLDPGRLTYRRFLELFRHMVGLLGRVISPSQGLYIHRITQHRKTRTNIHALSGIRTHVPSNQPAKTHTSDRTAAVTGMRKIYWMIIVGVHKIHMLCLEAYWCDKITSWTSYLLNERHRKLSKIMRSQLCLSGPFTAHCSLLPHIGYPYSRQTTCGNETHVFNANLLFLV
jgi:hypothetical protein